MTAAIPPGAGDGLERLEQLERQVAALSAQLEELRGSLRLVGDVQRLTPLRTLLQAGRLDEADRETARLLEEELQNGDAGISPASLERLSAPLLRSLDDLWATASGGRQGFAAQQRLYRSLGGSRQTLIAQDAPLFRRFSEAVGWPLLAGVGFAIPDELTVPAAAAVDAEGVVCGGHLPLRCWASDYGLKAATLLMARLLEVFPA
ncbi:MAG: GUN4 domain-containing protein [Synechococcaceae cyanobacterium]|nr:GUN4 domain-containing protein [Synechococcaceae cyanobacterium]